MMVTTSVPALFEVLWNRERVFFILVCHRLCGSKWYTENEYILGAGGHDDNVLQYFSFELGLRVK